jgi:hypothetical protein
MSKPAKDKAELIGLIADVLRACPSSKDLYKGAAAAIENLLAENARLREALTWYVNHGAWPVELVRDGGETARAALDAKP